jgi:hypothetical protein
LLKEKLPKNADKANLIHFSKSSKNSGNDKAAFSKSKITENDRLHVIEQYRRLKKTGSFQ